MWRVAYIALAIALISPAHAQDAPRARLLTVPDAQAMSDVFPPVALARGVSGRAVLSCDVAADGAAACRAIEQTPENLGFGAAAETLSANWRFEPIAGTVRVPVEFQNAATEPAIIENSIGVDGGQNVDRSRADANYQQLMSTYHALAACRWSGRPQCATSAGEPDNLRILNNITFYPEAAQAAGVNGRALIACAFRSGGRADCAIEGASPSDYGFGEAALALVSEIAASQSAQFELGQVIRVPVDFAMIGRDGSRRTHWSEMPSGADFARAYPRSNSQPREGRTMLGCTILETRRLTCTALESTTPEYGRAGEQIARGFRVSPDSIGLPGFAIGDRLKIPITFRTA